MATFDHSSKKSDSNTKPSRLTSSRFALQKAPAPQPAPNPEAPINRNLDENGNPAWLSRLTFDPPRYSVQPKLNADELHDQQEQEADRPNQPALPMPHLQRQERDFTPIPEQAMAQMRSWSATQSPVPPQTQPQPEPNVQAQSDPVPYSRPAWCDRLTFNPQRPSMVQAKLTVGAPNDQYEQEADAVASQVMAMPEPTQQPTVQQQTIDPQSEEEEAVQTKPMAHTITPLLQRETAPEAEEDEIQLKPLGNIAIQREAMPEDEKVQTKPLGTVQREAMPEEEEVQTKAIAAIQREEIPEEEEVQAKPLGTVQREEVPEEEEVQTKALDGSAIQREAATEGDEEELQTKRLEAAVVQREALPDEEEAVQTKPLGNAVLQREAMPQEEETVQPKRLQRFTDGSLQADSNLETQLSSSRGGGSPLSDDVRSFMEPRFGADLSQVRVHTGASAVQMNKDLSAQAFTHKQDIFFGAGKSPGKNDLTAHELTHVVQQSGAVRPKVVPSLQKDNKLQTKAAPGQVSDLEAKKLPRENSPPTTADVGHQAQPGVQHGAATTAGSPGAGKPSTKVSPGATGGTGAPSPHKAPGGKAASAAIGGNIAEGTGSQSNKVASGKPRKVLAGGAIGAGSGGTVLGNGGKPIAGGAVIAGGKTAPASPHQDPAFQAVVDKVKNVGQQQKQHDPAPAKAQEAQCAAVAPANEVESKAQANQVGQMEQAETPPFNAAEFKAALMQKIAEAAPKNMEEADDFKKNNKLEPVKGELGGKVKDEKQTTQKPLEEKTKQAPDTSGIAPKPVTPLLPAQSGQAPASVGAEQAVPKPKGQGEVEAPIHADSQKVDQKMAEANVTEEQLAKSNEPSFQSTLKSKQTAQTSAAQIPQEYRQFEQGQLAQAKGEATATAQDKTQGMHVDRAQVMSHVGGHQVETKGKDEQERTKIAGDINQIYQDTKTKVDNALKDLDNQVGEKFDAGANKAKQDFENHVEQKMNAYKEKRYNFSKDPIGGAALWVWDKLAGMPSEVNAFYEEGRNLYLKQMDEVIDQVVTIVGTGLNKAKTEVANGKQKVQAYVSQLPENLKTIGQQAASDIQSKFGELEQTIDSKKDELIDTLAQKYQEKLEAVDASIQEKKDANRGLIEKAIDAVVGVIKTIIELGKLLLQVLARVVSVIPQILKDPIGFFNNLASGIKQGFQNFSTNIVTHLKKGLISWLTGALAGAGIQLPEKFDLQGIFSLVAQILGFGYEVIRAGLVKRFGEKKVSYMEKTVKVFQVLMAQGIAGLWQFVQEKIGDLKAMVMDNIQNFLIESIVKAGIMWVLSLLNPASAFVRACKAIYDLVTFFMENAERIANFINTLLDSITAIAAGNVAKVANGIESALAQAIPLVLELLAKLLGLGNVSHKVHEIIKKLQKPIKTAIDWVIEKAVKAAKFISKKIDFGKGRSKAKKNQEKSKDSNVDERNQKQKQADLAKALAEIRPLMQNEELSWDDVKKQLPAIKTKYKMTSCKLIVDVENEAETVAHVNAEINPTGNVTGKRKRDANIEAAADERFQKIAESLENRVNKRSKIYKPKSGIFISSAPLKTLAKNTLRQKLPRRIVNKTDIKRWLAGKGRLILIQELGLPMAQVLIAEGKQNASALNLQPQNFDQITFVPPSSNNSFGDFTGIPGSDEKEPVDQDLKTAVKSKGIVSFMKGMGVNKRSANIDIVKLNKLWNVTVNREFLKNEFRAADLGKHEWIPTNYIPNVIDRANSVSDAIKAAQWIDLHHELRTDTGWVIFDPNYAKGEIIIAGKRFDTLVGHSGALYVEDPTTPGTFKAQTTNQNIWHDELRSAFDSNTTPSGVISGIQSIFQKTVWNGSQLGSNIYDVYYRSPTGGTSVTKSALATEQKTNFGRIDKFFNTMKAKYK